ncbi:MAG: IS110 family transposase [Firmicutes bacterium]|nr:IS110 family transposase [Bacillota bacterium]
MQVVYERCCGVDVHKKTIVACFKDGKKHELRQYGTKTKELKVMADWLLANNCEIVAMESTGSFWKPLYNVLEALGLELMVVNAAHMKTVPGRKTDKKDAEWIADLLQHGLLKASYIPNREQRELREVSRYRKSLVGERSREINRLQKMLEGANIKLSSVVSNINGKSSRRIIAGLVEDQTDEEYLLKAIDHSMVHKMPELLEAIDRVVTSVQRKLIKAVVNHIDDMTIRIKEMDDIINGEMERYEKALEELEKIPGIGRQSAQTILAEIGIDMTRFPSAGHISSWAGLSPGNNESAGKRGRGKTTKGNITLKTTLIQCARAAVRKKDTFFRVQYDRLVVRRGANRAAVAVAHSILIAIYNILKKGVPFRDLGADYYYKFNTERKILTYLNKLKELGWEPTVTVAS